jgi:hypothetical protein
MRRVIYAKRTGMTITKKNTEKYLFVGREKKKENRIEKDEYNRHA